MNIIEFSDKYKDEAACVADLKQRRDLQVKECPHCGCTEFYWKGDKAMYECKKCHYRMSLKKGTIMENSNLPIRTWYLAIHLMTATKQSMSACELQRQLGIKSYETAHDLMHKLRDAMGQREGLYKLDDEVELDEMFFDVAVSADEELKRGAGSQAKAKVVVMAGVRTPTEDERRLYESKNRGSKVLKAMNYIKMKVVSGLHAEEVENCAAEGISHNACVVTDAHVSHSQFAKMFARHEAYSESRYGVHAIVTSKLPWVHLVAKRCKESIAGIHEKVTSLNLKRYLDEFYYKFNRRRYEDGVFDRLIVACITTSPRIGFRRYDFV